MIALLVILIQAIVIILQYKTIKNKEQSAELWHKRYYGLRHKIARLYKDDVYDNEYKRDS